MSSEEYKAIIRYVPTSPSKIRPIANLIRRRSYVDAEALLGTLPNKGAFFLLKLLRSASENAAHLGQNIDPEQLIVRELIVNEGSRQKRIWARGRGRADRQLKRSSHISVVLGTK